MVVRLPCKQKVAGSTPADSFMDEKCVRCGSRYELTEHHDRQLHLNRKEKTDNHKVVLCATCHYLADYWKMFNCYHKALLKKYNQRMKKLGL